MYELIELNVNKVITSLDSDCLQGMYSTYFEVLPN